MLAAPPHSTSTGAVAGLSGYLAHSPADLTDIYRLRFARRSGYRQQVWTVLTAFFARWIPRHATVLDLGAGYCEFINNVRAGEKFAMDLNPEVRRRAHPGTTVLEQDCATPWALPENSLDVVFTSNFFEHLPSKMHLERTLAEAYRTLKTGGRLVALGPNIKYLPGAYWDFQDHYLPLTELSLAELLEKRGFQIETLTARFLPYTMSFGRQYPIWMLRAYLRLPLAWRFFGKQFLVVARKTA